MTDKQIQELILQFLDARGGYVASASERELFLMIKQAVDETRRNATAEAVRSFMEIAADMDRRSSHR